jgi:hypothetical protein
MNFLKLDVLWRKKLARAKTMDAKYFKKHKVLKNSLDGRIWSDFEKVSLKMSAK